MGEEETQKSVWNFDGAELYLIFQIKSTVVEALESWDIKNAYKKVRLLRMEIDSKLQREKKKIIEDMEDDLEEKKSKLKGKKLGEKKQTEKQKVDEMIKDLDNIYTDFLNITNPTDAELSFMYQSIEYVYMELCYIMKKHGLYFREGEDMRLAVLRR